QILLGGTATHPFSQLLYKAPLYNSVTNFAPIALVAETPAVLIARKELPPDNLQQFIAYTKANQAKMQYGSAGSGSASHLACVLFNSTIGVNLTHIPYLAGPHAIQDMIAGRLQHRGPLGARAVPPDETQAPEGERTLS